MEIEIDVRSLIFKELYKSYGVHFLSHDIKIIYNEKLTKDVLDNGCRLIVKVKEIYE